MLNYYKALNKLKAMYPKNAKVTYSNPGNVLVFDIKGDGNRQLKIFISIAWDGSECSIFGVDGMKRFEDAGLGSFTGNKITQSTPMGTVVAYYKG